MECKLVYSDFIFVDDRYLWSMLSTLRIQGYILLLFEVFLKLVKHKLIHNNFQLGKVESVVKVKQGSMSGPFKAGMDWPFLSWFAIILQSETSKFSLWFFINLNFQYQT